MLSKTILIFLTVTCLSAAEKDEQTELHPLENPDLFEGDIVASQENRNAIVDKRKLWPRGVVPYVIENGINAATSNLIKSAMQDYEKNTCIRFVPRTTQKNYVRIFRGQGCYSIIGMSSGAQPLSLGNGCGNRGTILHEIGHAVGFHHEHNRSDRDRYVNILWNNIQNGQASQFAMRKPNQNWLITPFDYDSIMLYGSYTFSKDRNKLKTIVKKDGSNLKSVHQKFLSASDITRVKKLYNC